MTQSVKNLPALRETRVRSLGREDPLEEEMATHSSFLAWTIHGQRGLAGCNPWRCKESRLSRDRMTSSPPSLCAGSWYQITETNLCLWVKSYQARLRAPHISLQGAQEFQASCATSVSKWELAWRLPVFLVFFCDIYFVSLIGDSVT